MISVKKLIYRVLSPIILDRVNLTLCVVLNGKVVKIPTIGRIGYNHLQLEDAWMIDLLEMLFPMRDGTFVDIGANLGQALIKAKCIEPTIRYVGFEPNPVCVHYTRTLIKQNRFKNCSVVSAGISVENGVLPLSCFDSETSQDGTIIEGLRSQEVKHQFLVAVERFEYVYDKLNLGKLSVVKIDVEGAELEVIQGMEPLLETDRPFIVCEILPVGCVENASGIARQEQVERIIKAHRYCMCRIGKKKNGHLAGLTRIETIGVHADVSLRDYLFVPDELVDRVFG